ncbi:MAG TPA: zf-HC2 domain-containing protein [Blastocatellia bacterium]|nr:zf-HC2 domain-containing protein [Blastocatellia bacterium]
MNCRRVRKLIPLYVEDDLAPSAASRIAAHLEWCGRCNWLADEYKESQSWLHTLTPPEFDEALLDDVKHGVLTEIAATRQRPSMLALLAQHWGRRQVLALSAAVLMIFALVVLYVYQARLRVDSALEAAGEPPREEIGPPIENGSPERGSEAAPGAGSQAPHIGSRGRRHLAKRLPKRSTPVEKEPQRSFEVASQSAQTITPGDTSTGSKEMLRIEIQTSDPLIRIIWFAPKETDQHQSKPATD